MQSAVGVSMSYIQNQAEAMKIQVRLFKEEPFALGLGLREPAPGRLVIVAR